MRALVLGAGGMAGHAAVISLAEKGHSVTGLARRKLPFCDTVVADVRDAALLKTTIRSGGFDAVINCVGVLNRAVDANPYDGIWINSCLPHLLAGITEGSPSRVVHLSTDCVFSGREGGGYTENRVCSADSLYGRSKALGELDGGRNLTIRTSIVGPDINVNGVGLFNWFMSQKGAVNGYTQVIWTGVTTIVLADAIECALRQGLTGLYHLVNGSRIDKCGLLRLFNGLRREPVDIVPADTPREDKSLVNSRADFAFCVPPYKEMVSGMGEWINRHRELYPHYEIRG